MNPARLTRRCPRGYLPLICTISFAPPPTFFPARRRTARRRFAELARLGVRTILNVDGSRPDVETAHQHGLRYVHLPIGYDGVSARRVAELAAAARSSSGPIYVHCHHGLHRGPAAVAVIGEATAGWTTNQAVAWLHQAGTASEYGGLYRSAVTFRPPDPAVVGRVTELPEVARTSSLVETMVAIDAEFDRLKAAQKTGWKSGPNPPTSRPRTAPRFYGSISANWPAPTTPPGVRRTIA
jgi:protein tyrosine phosphatase (PTP) superfamily phosphohydrolase (DUF442 family)